MVKRNFLLYHVFLIATWDRVIVWFELEKDLGFVSGYAHDTSFLICGLNMICIFMYEIEGNELRLAQTIHNCIHSFHTGRRWQKILVFLLYVKLLTISRTCFIAICDTNVSITGSITPVICCTITTGWGKMQVFFVQNWDLNTYVYNLWAKR